jgi:hypothetical protein
MSNSNQLPVLREILELQRDLTPLLERFDVLKATVREFGPGEYPVDGLGVVKVSEPSVKKPKGTEIKLNLEVFNTLPGDEQAQLLTKGLVMTETLYTRAAASSVKVECSN